MNLHGIQKARWQTMFILLTCTVAKKDSVKMLFKFVTNHVLSGFTADQVILVEPKLIHKNNVNEKTENVKIKILC